MSGLLATIVDTKALVKMLWTASLAGVSVTALFGIALHGATRAVDLGREGRAIEAAISGIVGAIALAGVLAAIAFGIVVMTQK